MSKNGSRLSPADETQTDGNLRLATVFIREYLDEPERYGPIPLGAAVILLPPKEQGDSALRQANMQMAEELAAEGRDVVLWTVGAEEPGKSQNLYSQAAAGRDD